MSIKEIRERIEVIQTFAGDSERAHEMEDSLREDFIKFISTLPAIKFTSCTKEMAKLVLSTNDISFERWCA